MYDPSIGRFHVMDILAEHHFSTTPYHYTFNNPINYIDPFGLDSIAPVYCYGTAPKQQTQSFGWWIFGLNRNGGTDWGVTAEHHESRDLSDWISINPLYELLWKIFGGDKEKRNKKDEIEESTEPKTDEEIVKETAGNNEELIQIEVDKRSGIINPDKKSAAEDEEEVEVEVIVIRNVAGGDSAGVGKVYYSRDSTSKGNRYYRIPHDDLNNSKEVTKNQYNAAMQ